MLTSHCRHKQPSRQQIAAGANRRVNESLHDYFGTINDTVHFKLAGSNAWPEGQSNINAARISAAEIRQIVDTRIEKPQQGRSRPFNKRNRPFQTVLLITLTVLAALAAISWLLPHRGSAHRRLRLLAKYGPYLRAPGSSRVPVEACRLNSGAPDHGFQQHDCPHPRKRPATAQEKTNDIHAMFGAPRGIDYRRRRRGRITVFTFLQTILETSIADKAFRACFPQP